MLRWLSGRTRATRSTQDLDGLRAVGAAAYSLASDADELRRTADWNPWTQSVQTQVFLVASWNAYVLQTTADGALGEQEALDPPRAVP